MVNVTQLQWDQRWDTLPENIREYLYAPEATEALGKILGGENLKEDAYAPFARTVGFVLMGFLKPENLASELAERLPVTPETASRLADKTDKEIFSNFRNELVIIFSPPRDPASMPAPSEPPAPAPFNPVNSTFSSPVPPSAFPQTPSAPPASPVPGAPSPLPSSAPAPSIMASREVIRPIESKGGARFGFSDTRFRDIKPGTAAPKPAELEIGAKPSSAPAPDPQPPRTDALAPKVVHYSQWRATSPAAPAAAPSAPEAKAPVPFADLMKPAPLSSLPLDTTGATAGTNTAAAPSASPQASVPSSPVSITPPPVTPKKPAPPLAAAPAPSAQAPAPQMNPAPVPVQAAPANPAPEAPAPKPIAFTEESKKAGFLSRFGAAGVSSGAGITPPPSSAPESPAAPAAAAPASQIPPVSSQAPAPQTSPSQNPPPKIEASGSDMIDLGSL